MDPSPDPGGSEPRSTGTIVQTSDAQQVGDTRTESGSRVGDRRLRGRGRERPTGRSDRRALQSPLHLRRLELKYVVPERLIERFIERITPFTELDPFLVRSNKSFYPVTSLYFDSFELQSLFEKESGWLSRRKIRLRTYEQEFSATATCFLEIKRRHDFLVSKDRLPLSVGPLDWSLFRTGLLRNLLKRVRETRREVADEAQILRAWYNLRSTALVRYRRMAFVGKHDRNLRLTVDSHLQGIWRPPALLGSLPYGACGMDPMSPRLMAYGTHIPGFNLIPPNGWNVIEFKFNQAIPEWLHGIVKDMELVRSAYSKYAMVVRGLRPQLFEGF